MKLKKKTALKNIERASPEAYQVTLDKIDFAHFCNVDLNVPSYGIATSNMAEAGINMSKDCRSMSPIDAFLRFSDIAIKKAAYDSQIAREINDFSIRALQYTEKNRRLSVDIDVRQTQKPGIFTVQYTSGKREVVDIGLRTCSCNAMSYFPIPCPCICALARQIESIEIESFIGDCFSARKWVEMYGDEPLNLPSKEDLEIDELVLMPPFEPQKSSKSKKRNKKRLPSVTDVMGRPGRKCGACGETGHYKGTCPKAAQNKKKKTSHQEKQSSKRTTEDENACFECKEVVADDDSYEHCKRCGLYAHKACILKMNA